MADKKADNIYILITHTHGDHSGAVGTMLSYVWFVLNRQATIIAPSGEVMEDLLIFLAHRHPGGNYSDPGGQENRPVCNFHI